MPLRLVNKERSYPVTILDTVFHIVSMTVGEKEQLLYKLSTINQNSIPAGKTFASLLDLIAPAIKSIDGFDGQIPREVLGKLEDYNQIQIIIKAIIEHCGLSDDEAKNSLSLSEQAIPVSTGSVEMPVEPDDAPVLTDNKIPAM
jgi:hypothetical protein